MRAARRKPVKVCRGCAKATLVLRLLFAVLLAVFLASALLAAPATRTGIDIRVFRRVLMSARALRPQLGAGQDRSVHALADALLVAPATGLLLTEAARAFAFTADVGILRRVLVA